MTDIKKTPAIAVETDPEKMLLTLTFADGQVKTIEPGIFTLEATGMFTPEIANRALLHGLKQKLVDAAAISRNPDTGRSATISDKKAAVLEVLERLLAGQWNKTREGAEQTGGLLLSALCRIYSKRTAESLKEWLGAKTAEQRTALRNEPKIAAMIATIKAERAKDDEGAPDTDAMLGELE